MISYSNQQINPDNYKKNQVNYNPRKGVITTFRGHVYRGEDQHLVRNKVLFNHTVKPRESMSAKV